MLPLSVSPFKLIFYFRLTAIFFSCYAALGMFDLIHLPNLYSGHLQHLKKLIIAVDASLDDHAAAIGLHDLTGDGILVNLLGGLISHLPWTNDLELSFRSEDFTQAYRNGIAALFGHLFYSPIDQLLLAILGVYGRATFASRPPTITLTFNVHIDSAREGFDAQEFCEAGYLFLQQSFPFMNSGAGRKKFENKVSKFSPRDGKHHYDITFSLICSN
jgi:hypothetical protein